MRVFISYSHKDAGVLDRLHVHLKNLQRDGQIETWFDRDILAGDVLDDEIKRELEAAELFLLLVTPDFIASDYCVETEMKRALELHEAGKARVVPIIAEPCDWAAMKTLRRLKALPSDGKPISDWANSNTAFLNVIQEIRRIIEAQNRIALSKTDAGLREASNITAKYRIQKTFDSIDRSEFCDEAFKTVKAYFRRAISEINSIEGLRGRFVEKSEATFGGTLVNRERQNSTAHITVHRGQTQNGLGDIYFSFQENAASNTAQGSFRIDCDEYQLFLTEQFAMFANQSSRLSAEQAAENLWNKFIEQVGIDHA